MSIIIEMFYREYCRARLAEMRKQLFIPLAGNGVQQAPPVDREACEPDDRGSDGVGKENPTIR